MLNNGMWRRFFREYLGYPKKERRGIKVLVLIMLIVVVYRLIANQLLSTALEIPTVDITQLSDSTSQRQFQNLPIAISKTPIGIDTASIPSLCKIGFSKYQATIINHYLKKGGKIYNTNDLSEIYSIDEVVLNSTKSLIIYPDSTIREKDFFAKSNFKKKRKALLELNAIDSATLDAMYFMSSSLSGRIINYRNRLGGFFELSQLKLVYGVDSLVYANISPNLTVDSGMVTRVLINKVSMEQLAIHPYIGYKLAKVISNYRLQHGPFKSKVELKKIILINEEIFRKIERYIDVK